MRVVRNALTTVRNQQRVTIPGRARGREGGERGAGRHDPDRAGRRGLSGCAADARLERGSCLLESELGVVDASLETQLKALENAFRAKIQAQG